MRGIVSSFWQRSLRDDRVKALAKPAEMRPRGLGQLFRDLQVRPKLMVLHNVFFVVLTVTIYFALGHEIPARAQANLIVILGAIYVLAVLLLETTIMPLYVYRPLQLMLDADNATQDDDREHELIDDREIPGDEIGQIRRSRNLTILQLRKHEEDLQDAMRRLEAQDRLVHLGLMSASVAHELNTPLSVLQGSIEKLTETTKDAVALDRLARMLRVTQRIKKISESLVDFSRARTEQMGPVPVQPLIAESWGRVSIDEQAQGVRGGRGGGGGGSGTVWVRCS